MERVLQYWDDLDDLVGAFGLVWERVRMKCLFTLYTVFAVLLQICGILLALTKPPLALAVVTILAVVLIYKSATQPRAIPIPT